MYEPVLDDVCDNCIFFRAFINAHPSAEPDGECRRFPPVFTPVNQGDGAWIERFPKVHSHIWCGEFKVNPAAIESAKK
jgi:hypothetical protein